MVSTNLSRQMKSAPREAKEEVMDERGAESRTRGSYSSLYFGFMLSGLGKDAVSYRFTTVVKQSQS